MLYVYCVYSTYHLSHSYSRAAILLTYCILYCIVYHVVYSILYCECIVCILYAVYVYDILLPATFLSSQYARHSILRGRFCIFSSSAGSATGGHNTDSVIKEIPQPDAASPQEKPGASLERSTGQVGSAANRTRADHSRAQTQTAPILTPEPANLRELDGSSNVVTATATAIAEVGDNLEDRVIRLERLVKAQEEIIQQQAEDIALLKRAAGVTALSAQPSTSGQQS